MSTPDGAATNKPTERQEQVLNYLKSHRINEELNVMINRVCKEMSDDPFGHLAREALTRAKAPTITRLVGREILDSRGNPTVETDVYALVGGKEKLVGRSGAPSGASTGSNEACELRDDEKDRYLGKGVQKAVANVSKLSKELKGYDPRKLRELDELIVRTDGTSNKSNIGGNAITATSFALAEAGAFLTEKPLFLFFAEFFHGVDKTPNKYSLPRPMVNILNGGKHAGGELKIQEFMIVPKVQKSFKENLRIVTEVYHHLGKLLVKKKGLSAKNLGDEGGYAPDLRDPHETLSLIEEAITLAHYKVGEDVFLALDCAASEFYEEGKYEIEKGKFYSSAEALQYYLKLKKDHPALISIEDPLDEKDYDGWTALTAAFAKEYGKDVMIIGDDLYTTNPHLIRQGVEKKWANSLLLKVNQIGTISEAMDAAHLIFNDHGNVAVSHRSGETPSSIISDLAVGIGAGFIKTGATARGERIAKYNRLLQIEEYLIENELLA